MVVTKLDFFMSDTKRLFSRYPKIVTRELHQQILDRFSMKDSKPRDTPIANGDKFSLKQCPNNNLERNEIQKISYASTVESLMYFDSDFAGCQDSKYSTFRYIYMLAEETMSWKFVKQTLIILSTMAINLRVVDGIERLLKFYCDNNSIVIYSNNNRNSTKSKFINIKFLTVKKKVQINKFL
ncbi:hypothetical protein CR513_37493, partial [Mucuna pruriens]